MRITAGILIIIGGFIGGTLWFGIVGDLISHFVRTLAPLSPDKADELALTLALPIVLIRSLPVFLAMIGGYYALKRKHWRWALTGAICSLLFPFTGIPALILLIKSKGEFESKSLG